MLVAERGAARLTLSAYRGDLVDFQEFLAGGAIEVATTDDLRRYLTKLKRARLQPRTAARRLSALRQFYRFLLVDGRRQDDPTTLLDAPRLGRPLPKLVNESEAAALLEQARAKPGEGGDPARLHSGFFRASG